jgi:hypothetical protein
VLNYILVTIAFHIDSGSFNFGSGTNNQQDYIKLRSIIYGDGASWIGASTKRFVDGYVQTRSTTAFVLPVGHSGFMRQQVTPSTSEGVDAGFRSTPNSIGSVLGESISSISSIEYWDIKVRE